MSTRQAEDILKHTFKHLEKMLKDVRRQESLSRQLPKSVQERKNNKQRVTDESEKKKT